MANIIVKNTRMATKKYKSSEKIKAQVQRIPLCYKLPFRFEETLDLKS